MANTGIAYQEVRINVRDPQLTHVYVFVEIVSGEYMHMVEGWRHKVFPAAMSMQDILKAWAEGKEDPLLWDMGAPA